MSKVFTKLSVLYGIIIFLIVTNISTVATILFHARQQNQTMVIRPTTGSDIQVCNGKFFRENLQLNPSQLEKFNQINPNFREKAAEIAAHLADYRTDLLTEMQKPHPDTTVLTTIATQIGHEHARLKNETWKYFINLKNMCDSSQTKRLNGIFTEIFENDNRCCNTGQRKHGNRKMHCKQD